MKIRIDARFHAFRLSAGLLLLLAWSPTATSQNGGAPSVPLTGEPGNLDSISGGIGGTGNMPGGIGGTGISGYGTIQGFGSIYLNGKEYFLKSSTRIAVNGNPAKEADLHVGDIVSVEGRRNAHTGQYTATRIATSFQIQGPVEAVNPASGTVKILGQEIYVAPGSYILQQETDQRLGLHAIQPGDVLAMNAFARGDHRWTATRLLRLTPSLAGQFILQGRLESMDLQHRTVKLNGQTIALATDPLSADVKSGEWLSVHGTIKSGVLYAGQIKHEQVLIGKTGNYVDMQGYPVQDEKSGLLTLNGLRLRPAPGMRFPAIRETEAASLFHLQGILQQDGSIIVNYLRLDQDGLRIRAGSAKPKPAPQDNPDRSKQPGSEFSRPEASGMDSSPYQRPEFQRPEFQRPEFQRPEFQRPEFQRPEFQRPEFQRPEFQQPEIQRPEIQRPEIQQPDFQRPDFQQPNYYGR